MPKIFELRYLAHCLIPLFVSLDRFLAHTVSYCYLDNIIKMLHPGCGCSTVGRVAASNNRGLRFESSNQHFLFMKNMYSMFTVETTKI